MGREAAEVEEDPSAELARYESAIEQGEDDPRTLTQCGVLLWRHYEFPRAVELFARAVADSRSDLNVLWRIANCYFEVGRFAAAANVMRVAVERQQSVSAETLNTLAWTLERDHQVEPARALAEQALALDPQYGPAARLLAHLDRRAGEFEQAARRLRDHLQRFKTPFDWGLRYELAAVLDRLGTYDDAWHELQQAKLQLLETARPHVNNSRFIRQRQGELTERITAADLRRWQQDGRHLSPSRRICLLCGFPRSGTTLLEQILAANSGAVDTDESGILPSQFIDPIVWRAADAARAIVEIRSLDRDQLQVGRETFVRFTENYLGEPVGDRLLIEKNPLLTADLGLPLRLFPEALVLVTLRDPRDVLLSYLMTMVPLNWSSAAAIDVAEAARFYADTLRHWLWWRDRLQQPACELRYERMIADPAGEAQRLTEFLGLNWEPGMLSNEQRAERRAVRTPTYDDITKPLYTRAIGRWQHYARHLEAGLAWLEPYVQEFGYT